MILALLFNHFQSLIAVLCEDGARISSSSWLDKYCENGMKYSKQCLLVKVICQYDLTAG